MVQFAVILAVELHGRFSEACLWHRGVKGALADYFFDGFLSLQVHTNERSSFDSDCDLLCMCFIWLFNKLQLSSPNRMTEVPLKEKVV